MNSDPMNGTSPIVAPTPELSHVVVDNGKSLVSTLGDLTGRAVQMVRHLPTTMREDLKTAIAILSVSNIVFFSIVNEAANRQNRHWVTEQMMQKNTGFTSGQVKFKNGLLDGLVTTVVVLTNFAAGKMLRYEPLQRPLVLAAIAAGTWAIRNLIRPDDSMIEDEARQLKAIIEDGLRRIPTPGAESQTEEEKKRIEEETKRKLAEKQEKRRRAQEEEQRKAAEASKGEAGTTTTTTTPPPVDSTSSTPPSAALQPEKKEEEDKEGDADTTNTTTTPPPVDNTSSTPPSAALQTEKKEEEDKEGDADTTTTTTTPPPVDNTPSTPPSTPTATAPTSLLDYPSVTITEKEKKTFFERKDQILDMLQKKIQNSSLPKPGTDLNKAIQVFVTIARDFDPALDFAGKGLKEQFTLLRDTLSKIEPPATTE